MVFALLVIGSILVPALARRQGVRRWVAAAMPSMPLLPLLAYFLVHQDIVIGRHGGVPAWFAIGIAILIGTVLSTLVALLMDPKEQMKKSS